MNEIERLERKRDAICKELEEAHKTYGKWLRVFRQKNSISLRTFAKQLEISAPYLSDIEVGNRHASKRIRDSVHKIYKTL